MIVTEDSVCDMCLIIMIAMAQVSAEIKAYNAPISMISMPGLNIIIAPEKPITKLAIRRGPILSFKNITAMRATNNGTVNVRAETSDNGNNPKERKYVSIAMALNTPLKAICPILWVFKGAVPTLSKNGMNMQSPITFLQNATWNGCIPSDTNRTRVAIVVIKAAAKSIKAIPRKFPDRRLVI